MDRREKELQTLAGFGMYIIIFVMALLLTFTILTFLYSSSYADSCMQANVGANYLFIFASLLLLIAVVIVAGTRGMKSESGRSGKHGVTEDVEDEMKQDSHDSEKVRYDDSSELRRDTMHLIRNLLQDDEYRIMEIVIENEGVTQDSIHFRTGFSHSKISMIMKKLEEKNLIVRERFGKTYRVYPSEWVRRFLT